MPLTTSKQFLCQNSPCGNTVEKDGSRCRHCSRSSTGRVNKKIPNRKINKNKLAANKLSAGAMLNATIGPQGQYVEPQLNTMNQKERKQLNRVWGVGNDTEKEAKKSDEKQKRVDGKKRKLEEHQREKKKRAEDRAREKARKKAEKDVLNRDREATGANASLKSLTRRLLDEQKGKK